MELYNFSEHVGIFRIDQSICDDLIPILLDMRDNLPSDGRSNVNGWQKNYLQDIPEFGQLKDQISNQFDLYIAKLHEMYYVREGNNEPKWAISIDNLFANVNGPGSYHVLHNHAGCNYSGVVYLQTPNQGGPCGNFYLRSPFYSPWMGSMQAETTKDYQASFESEKGMGLIFPAYMMHSVGPNMTNDDRIAVSFNLTVYFNQQLAHFLEESRE